ncbi:S-layer homology domain-containing protein [Cytobacillus oceanisediminis]|uniref:S-layer homology domain-containing protein n=1 Tax=Cytobacillus oceanisediminis TaxID=665099 RepID=UPI0037370CD5
MAYQPKSYRKFVAGAATAAIVASAVAPAASAAEVKFTDVGENFWAATEIYTLVEAGVINGYPDGTFKPGQSIIRGQAANLLTDALDLEIPSDLNAFPDVSEKSVFAEGAAATKAAGIFGGSNGQFGAADVLTREQMASVLVRAFGLEDNGEEVTFTDWNKISASHRENVKILAQNGITTGKEDGSFDPKAPVNRATFVTFLYRAMNLEPAPEVVEVVSVSAINPTKVEVKFNKAIDKDTLNKSVSINNVAVDGAELYELSEDGKTLNVRVSKLEVDKAYAVKVEGLKTVDGEEVPTFVEKVLFADSAAASIESVTAKAGTSGKTKIVEVVFSEDVTGTEANFRVNNVSPSSVTIVNNVATLVLPADIEAGKTHELRVAELADLSGNKTSVTQGFTLTTDTTAPVASVEVKDENTLVVKFNEPVKSANSTNIKVLKGNINVTGVIGALSQDGKSVEVQVNPLVFATNESSANVTVEVAGVNDLYDNAMTKATFSATLTKDVVAPTVAKVEGIVGTNKFVVSFSEELAGAAGDKVTVPSLFKDNMKLTVSDAALKADKDGNLTQVEVTTAANLEAGNYEVSFAEGVVTDDTIAKNKNAQTKVSFATTTPTGESDTGKPEVSKVEVAGDVLTVTFNEDVSSSAASYLNYKIDGVTIPSQSVIYFNNSKKVVTIELPTGYFTADKGDVIFEVANVSDLAGNTMNKFTKLDLVVEDTKAPSLASAKLAADNEIVLEFNEAIDTTSALVPGKLTIKDSTGASVLAGGNSITTGATASVSGKKVTITLAAGNVLDLTKSYTLTVEAGNGLVDQAGTDNDGTGIEAAPFSNVALVDGIAPAFKAGGDFFTDTTFDATNGVIGVSAPAISTTAFAIEKANLTEVPTSIKLVYSDADDATADVVVAGTVEIKADQSAFTYSFGAANLSSLKAGTVNVDLVLVDANGNESTGYNVVSDGTGTAKTELTLVK